MHITTMCQALNQLPFEGGVAQQPAYIMLGMRYVMEAMEDKAELDRLAKKKTKGK